jgi:hypothetical protein
MKAKLVRESLNETVTSKDIMRIKDIFTKGKGSDEKVIRLTQNMAKSITNYEKAIGRAEAAEQILGKNNNQLADIFYKRAEELNGGKPVIKTTTSLPEKNPKVDISELKDGYGGRRGYSNKGVIFLPTYSAIALWIWELTGQFSDGAWENAKPDDHWLYWTNLKTRFGQPEVQSTGRPLKTGYNLVGLIEYVGDRMLCYGRFGKAVGNDIFYMGNEVRNTIEDLPENGPFDLDYYKDKQIIEKNWRNKDYYWAGLDQDAIDKYYATKYDMKDLRRDLAIIKQAMNNRKGLSE